MKRKKTDWTRVGLGAGMVVVGAFLASPADEAIVTAATAGAGAVAAPIQLPATATVGGALVVGGIGLIVSGLPGVG